MSGYYTEPVYLYTYYIKSIRVGPKRERIGAGPEMGSTEKYIKNRRRCRRNPRRFPRKQLI